jgi:NAD(P)-dependent dehydrogenase (short-subunit alcohol dehydrogenase family)
VAVNYRRDQAAAEATAAEVGGRAYQASVAERAGCTALAEAVLADFGRVDVLVCNAGIASRGNTVVDTDPDELDRVVRTLAYGPFWLCQALLPQMRRLGPRRRGADLQRQRGQGHAGRRAVHDGQGGAGGARPDARGRGAAARHPHQHRRAPGWWSPTWATGWPARWPA